MPPMSAIWEKHRRYLITVAAGLAVFFIGVAWIQGYRGQALAREAKNRQLAGEIERQMAQLDFSYDKTMKESRVQDKRLQSLLAKVSMTKTARIRPREGDDGDPVIDFRGQKEKMWSDFGERANRINLKHPTPKEVDFGLSSELGPQEWSDRYTQLDIVRRIFSAAADLRFRNLESISPGPVRAEPIAGSRNEAVVRYPVRAKVELDYPTLVLLLERFQKDGSYVGIEISEVMRETDDPEGVIRATLDFVGVDIGEPRETRRRKKPTGGFGRGRR